MPSFGVPELLIILLIVVIFFGVGRLPELGGAVGKSISEFRKASRTDENPTTEHAPTSNSHV